MSEFTTILVVVILAVASPLLAQRIRIPGVVTEVLLGLALGLGIFLAAQFAGVSLVDAEGGVALAFLAEVGFIMLLFLVGLEIDFDRIEEQGLKPLLLGAALYAATIGLAYGFVAWAGLPFIMTLVLATTAVDVVLPTMREAGIHKTDLGQAVMLSATIADFVTISGLTAYIIFLKTGGAGLHPTYLIIPGLLLIFWLAYKLGGEIVWKFPRTVSRFFKAEDPTELGVRASLALMFVFVALSGAFGVETIFGAFFAGVLISLLFREGALLEEKLYGVGYGFFVPIFFISVGLKFDFDAFAVTGLEGLRLFPILLAAAVGVKLIPSLIFWPTYGLRKSLAIGMLLSARLSFMIAVASVALALDIIKPDLYGTIILLAVVLSTGGPSLFRAIMPKPPKAPVPAASEEAVAA
jgi:Kef-type K+ transport system membrane component KefB